MSELVEYFKSLNLEKYFYDPSFLLKIGTAMSGGLIALSASRNKLNYRTSFAKLVAGNFTLTMELLGLSRHNKQIENLQTEVSRTETEQTQSEQTEALQTENKAKGRLIALGPHRTGWEAIAFAALIKGRPPRFLATDAFNAIPGVKQLLEMFDTIIVKAKDEKDKTKSANQGAVEQACAALNDGDCIVLFPQGNFSLIGQEPHRVYEGIAKIALKSKQPIEVFRLDGFWSLQNPFIPLFIRNNRYYRSMISAFHPNSVKATECTVIDFHLDPNNKQSDDEKINEICAILYAYYQPTEELNEKQIRDIDKEIKKGRHRPLWNNKLKQYQLEKSLKALKEESKQLLASSSLFKKMDNKLTTQQGLSDSAKELHQYFNGTLEQFQEEINGDECDASYKEERAKLALRMIAVLEQGIEHKETKKERLFLSSVSEGIKETINSSCLRETARLN